MSIWFTNFIDDEKGAVTVDFVILTAATVLMGAVAVLAFTPGATGMSNTMEDILTNEATDFAAESARFFN